MGLLATPHTSSLAQHPHTLCEQHTSLADTTQQETHRQRGVACDLALLQQLPFSAIMANRPTAPILEGDLREPKTFYHNAAYKTSRVAINLEKMKVSFVQLARCSDSLLLRLHLSAFASLLCVCNWGSESSLSPAEGCCQRASGAFCGGEARDAARRAAAAHAAAQPRCCRCFLPPHRCRLPPTPCFSTQHKQNHRKQILEARLAECVSREGVNYVDKCEQLTKRFEAAVRVVQWQAGDKQRARNVGGILDEEKEIRRQLAAEGATA